MKRFRQFLALIMIAVLSFSLTGCGTTSAQVSLKSLYAEAVSNGSNLSYSEWLQTIKGEKGDKGDNAKSPVLTIDENGIWCINGASTGVSAKGMPNISIDYPKDEQGEADEEQPKHWYIDGVDTGVVAEGLKGEQGPKGDDGIKLSIQDDKLYVNGELYIDSNGNEVVLAGEQGDKGEPGYTYYNVSLIYNPSVSEDNESRFKEYTIDEEAENADLLTLESGVLLGFKIKSSHWLTNELPEVKDEYKDKFIGWCIQGGLVTREKYDFIGSDITLYALFSDSPTYMD